MLGRFNEFFLPVVEIEVRGTGEPKTLEAVVDTGSNGWLQLPYKEAFPLGLVLSGVEDGTTMADGHISHNFVCKGVNQG